MLVLRFVQGESRTTCDMKYEYVSVDRCYREVLFHCLMWYRLSTVKILEKFIQLQKWSWKSWKGSEKLWPDKIVKLTLARISLEVTQNVTSEEETICKNVWDTTEVYACEAYRKRYIECRFMKSIRVCHKINTYFWIVHL